MALLLVPLSAAGDAVRLLSCGCLSSDGRSLATDTFAVAFVGVLTVSRLPWARPGPALACCVAGSALVSAGQWLPSQPPGLPLVLRFCLLPTAHLGSVLLLLRPLMAATGERPAQLATEVAVSFR